MSGSRADPEGALVTSEIVGPDGAPPIKIDWRLTVREGLYRISDVIIDRVSMLVTERSEIAAMIQRSGGQAQGLLAMMREKTNAPAGALPAAAPPAPLPSGAPPPAAFPPGIGGGPPPR